jgi:CRP/FNR family transcriptional regulator, cyclic AMP receptor protein
MARSALSAAHLFSHLPDELTKRLFARSRPVKLAPDQVLFLAGDPGDGCYHVEKGLLKVSVASHSGGERILAILGSGALIGELAIIDGQPRSASVSAIRESELGFISRAVYEEFVREHPETNRHILTVLAQRLRDTNSIVAAASFLSTKGRVALALLSLAEAFGQEVGNKRILIRQKISQSDVAAMAGVARENVSRTLNDWMRQKLVSRVSSYYCLENKERLEAEAEI